MSDPILFERGYDPEDDPLDPPDEFSYELYYYADLTEEWADEEYTR